jgi:signal transduction histidine kinase
VSKLLRVLAGHDEPPAWRSPGSRRAAYAAAWALFGVLAVATIVAGTEGAQHRGPAGPGSALWLVIGLAACAIVPLLPRYPLLGWRIAWLAALLTPLLPGQSRVNAGYYLILAMALAVAGLRYGPPQLRWLAILALVPVWLWTPLPVHGPFWALWTGADWTYPVRVTIVFAVLTALLYAAGRWRRDRQELHAKDAEAREQRERSASMEERARIAREMHDIVAHHMSMIAVQAETAPYRVPDLPEAALSEFTVLGESAREALTDMRRLLGVLRGPEEGSPREPGSSAEHTEGSIELAPQPGLGEVQALVEAARRAGAQVALEMTVTADEEGRVVAVPPVVGLTAYRIIQESLSNAARHAPRAPIAVTVEQAAGRITVAVRNEVPAQVPAPETPAPAPRGERGPGAGHEAGRGTGHGLTGMRERAALVGGRVQAGPEPDGGFAVRAELPVAPSLATPAVTARLAGSHRERPS